MIARCALGLLAALAFGCGSRDEPAWSDAEWARIASMSPLPPLPPSPDNPHADDERAAELGRALFFETRWSRDGVTSCASCHDPARELADGRSVALARGRLARNTPTLRGSAWMRWQGWTGARDSVWAQALVPLEQDAEHGSSPALVGRTVAVHHAVAYERVFGPLPERTALEDEPGASARVLADVGRALEAYVRRLHPGESRFDRYVRAVRGGDARGGGHLSPSERRGLRAFVGEAGCFDCHHGPLLSDGEFHNLGLPMAIGVPDSDRGRADGALAVLASEHRRRRGAELRFLDAESPELVGAFRTPSLRNVARTAPYMHGGHLATLADVLDFYRALPGTARVGHRDGTLRALPRSVSTSDLEAFLRSLDGAPIPPRWLAP